MDTHGKTQLIAFTGNTETFTEQAVTLTSPRAKSRKITPPAGARWVETLSNPKKPNIWAGKGPSFDSDGVRDYFWRVLENGYMTHYKNDHERAAEMYRDSHVDMIQTFEGSCERDPMRINRDQEDARDKRNCTRKVIGLGKRTVQEKIWDYKTRDYRIRFVCEDHITKGHSHDSHGQHGRKPRYKDSLNHRPQD